MNRFVIFWLFCFPTIVAAQGKVKIGSRPTWITAVSYSENANDTVDSGGYYNLLSERQVHAELEQSYFRSAIKVLAETGLEYASAIQVNFDPSFEQLIFHDVAIIRGTKRINKLKGPESFEILRREQEMDRLVYDKSLDAILNIDDVQVGDIVEYSYTISGRNPVFDKKFFCRLRLNYGDPIGTLYSRVVSKSSRQLQHKTFNQAIEPQKEETNGLTSYTWFLNNVPALLVEDGIPSWYEPYQRVEFTEFAGWREVNDWAVRLYSTATIQSAQIDEKVSSIQAANLSLDRRISDAIRFVQDEVRYLSFSDGVQGYKPHHPDLVFKQRFGDCKDKSVLLSYILNKMGVESHPALVNSSNGKELRNSLPLPTLFDHCIVQFTLNDTTYWVDPTMSLERGSFKNSTTADYGFALVISPQTTSLNQIQLKDGSSSIKVYENYSFKMVGGSADLEVKTIYVGDEANSMRSYWKSNTAEEIKKAYTDFYANDYTDIKMEDYVAFEDNADDNILTTTEHYNIETFWKDDSTNGTYVTNLYGRIIAFYLKKPTTKVRAMPYVIRHPTVIDQTIIIHLPEPWTVTEKHAKVSSSAFIFESETDYVDDDVTLHYRYESLKDHVKASEIKNYLVKIDEATDHLDFQFTYRRNNSAANDAFNIPFLLIAIFLVPIIFLAMLKLYRYDPRSGNYSNAYDQFGGWLILPVIGIVLSPISTVSTFIKGNYFSYRHWEILTNPGHTSYNPPLGALILLEFVYFLGVIGFSFLLITLLIKRRTSFPKLICFLYAINASFLIVDTCWLLALNLPTAFADSSEIVSTVSPILTAAVWIPFFVYSDRVKGTFRSRLK